LIPGDVLLSVLGSQAKEHSLEQLVSLINSSASEYLVLNVEPSNDTLEFSLRSIPISVDLSLIMEDIDKVLDPQLRSAIESTVAKLSSTESASINVRSWIKIRGSFNMLSTLLSKFYSMAISKKLTKVASHKPDEVHTGDRVLFSHREGYSRGSVSEVLSSNRFRLRLDVTNQVVEALLEEINLANPEALDGVEDLLLLEHANESTFVYNLHSRFLSSLPYTYCADLALVAINPMRELNIYTDSVAAPSQLNLPQHGVDAEDVGLLQDFRVLDPALPPQLQYSVEASEMEVIQLPGWVRVDGPGLRSVKEWCRDDGLYIFSLLKQLFFNCHNRLDMPPHVYSVAQTALARLDAVFYLRQHYGAKSASEPPTGQSEAVSNGTLLTTSLFSQPSVALKIPTQAICLLGRSGAGKSISTEHILEYCICPPKVRAVCCLLDAFTCSRTLLNTNASRSMRLFTIELTPSCSPSSPSSSSSMLLRPTRLQVDLFLLDKFRVTRRPEGEPTFHIFYYFLAGLQENLRRDFMLEDLSSPNLFMTPLQRAEDKALAKAHWEALCKAANLLGARFENEFMQGVCRLLAVIYHLGCAGATPAMPSENGDDSVRSRLSSRALGFINFSAAERAASLLGCSLEVLSSAVFEAPMGSKRYQDASSLDLLAGFVANLYAIAANSLKDLINSSLAPVQTRTKSVVEATMRTNTARLLVLDPPGLQCPESGGRASGGSFEDLLYNYANECLLQLYQNTPSTAQGSRFMPQCLTAPVETVDIKAGEENSTGSVQTRKRARVTTTDEMVSFLDNSNSISPSAASVAMAAANVAGGGQPGLEAGQGSFASEFVRRSLSPELPTRPVPALSQADASTGLLWLLDSATCSGNLQGYLRLVTQKYHEHKMRYSDRGRSLLLRTPFCFYVASFSGESGSNYWLGLVGLHRSFIFYQRRCMYRCVFGRGISQAWFLSFAFLPAFTANSLRSHKYL
uniref:Myosin motor domain-containing protein n=1 Tax=Schistocephalus solidus TaxID=70667 RepID=A0A183SRL2_SCHSO